MTKSKNLDQSSATHRLLFNDDLTALADTLRFAEDSHSIFSAIDALSAQVIGHRLFTIMRFDAARAEVERLYSNDPATYPIGGRKKKADTAWANQVLHDMKIFRADNPDAIRAAFDDHQTILGLGIGAILNIPLVYAGRCLGTMNFCHEDGWYGADEERTGVLLSAFLIPALLESSLAPQSGERVPSEYQ
ncbi:MAG TPA: hypothetical protein VHN11_12220 [Xanthobacteraceae bacterium]|jgi:GAF domain-containing protein|nr:hypothetical protein [Xanthobacteraceae bacterium]